MSDFGDFDPDDALDVEPADPEQVARRIHRLRLERGFETVQWDGLSPAVRERLVGIVVDVLAWLRRQGSG